MTWPTNRKFVRRSPFTHVYCIQDDVLRGVLNALRGRNIPHERARYHMGEAWTYTTPAKMAKNRALACVVSPSLRLSVSRRPVTCTSHFARAQADNTRDTTTSSSIQGKHGDSRQILHGASDPTSSQRPRSAAAAAAAVDRPARSVVQVAEFPSSHALVVDRVVGVSRHGAWRNRTDESYDSNVCRPGSKRALSRSLLSHALARCLLPHVARMHRFRDW